MKIYGPYLRKDGRKHVVIVKENGVKTTKSWPRLILEKHLGRELLPTETVDHIDEDKTNDSIENLQLLSLAENAAKAMAARPRQIYKFNCPNCGKEAEKYLNQVKHNWRLGKSGPYCSRKCAGKVHH